MNKIVFSSMLVISFFTNSLFASSLTVPDKCPSTSAIQSLGIDYATLNVDDMWIAGHTPNQYDTNVKWTFYVGQFSVQTSDEAMQAGRAALKSLQFFQGPEKNLEGDWVCVYYAGGGRYFAGTISPHDSFIK